jgi:hypothetical protein
MMLEPLCVRAFLFSRRFGREGILALACTCRIFHLGMHSEVQAARLSTALVEWPLCGAVVELTRNFSVGRGLFNGARCVVSKVGRDALEVHLLGPARKLQGMTSPVTVPRASVTPDGCRFGYPQPQNGCRFGYPRPHTFADWPKYVPNPDLSSLGSALLFSTFTCMRM